jgi:hypothetical protein
MRALHAILGRCAVTVAFVIGVSVVACQWVDPIGDLSSGIGDASIDQFVPPGDATSDQFLVPSDAGACDANLSQDDNNCGRCGHKCFGGGCKLGLCGRLLAFNGSVADMTYANGAIYWTSFAGDGGIEVFDVQKSQLRELAQATNPSAIAARDPYVVWASDSKIERTLLDGGARTTLATTTLPNVNCIGVTPSLVIWDNQTTNGFDQTSLIDGGAPTSFYKANIANCVRSTDAFALLSIGNPNEIVPIDLSSLGEGTHVPYGPNDLIAVSGNETYFALQNTVYFVTTGQSTATKIATTSKQVGAIAADANGVYWGFGDNQPANEIDWCPTPACAGGPRVLTNDSAAGAQHMVLSPDFVFYWSPSEVRVFKTAR